MASPLFPLHTGVDQNCFLTVGKAMLSGTVPYRDLYEQKGPLLYGLHALAAWMDSNGFFGVYLLEILNLTWMLWLYCKIAGLFLPDRLQFPAAALSGFVTVTAYCFSRGDNAEEFCLPWCFTVCMLCCAAPSPVHSPAAGHIFFAVCWLA